MTREEAIYILRQVNLNDNYLTTEAKKMGIEALSQGFFGDVIKPAVGAWQRIMDKDGISYRCTVCGYKRKITDSNFKYCPVCGVKMVK